MIDTIDRYMKLCQKALKLDAPPEFHKLETFDGWVKVTCVIPVKGLMCTLNFGDGENKPGHVEIKRMGDWYFGPDGKAVFI